VQATLDRQRFLALPESVGRSPGPCSGIVRIELWHARGRKTVEIEQAPLEDDKGDEHGRALRVIEALEAAHRAALEPR
jgi:hypothetical protein